MNIFVPLYRMNGYNNKNIKIWDFLQKLKERDYWMTAEMM